MRCLEKDPKRRPQTVAQLGSALAAIPAVQSRLTSRGYLQWVGVGAGTTALVAAGVLAVARLPDFRRVEAPAPQVELSSPSRRLLARTPPSLSDSQVVNVRISSEPPGARVIRADSGTELGFTPLDRPFSRTETNVIVRLELPGHKPIEQMIHPAEWPSVEVTMPKLKKPAKRRTPLHGFRNKIGRDGLINPFEK
jgi:serine/threonine-protein kinase